MSVSETAPAKYLIPQDECPEACPKCGCDQEMHLDETNFPVATHEIKKYYCGKCDFVWTELYVFQNWEAEGGE